MSFSDLQAYLRLLDKDGHLTRVGVEVDPTLEITEVATRLVRERGPALLFERVRGSSYPLCINLFGSEQRIELALGRHPAEIGEGLAKLAEDVNPPSLGSLWSHRSTLLDLLSMRTFRSLMPLSQEKAEAPDLASLPILKCWPGDGGRFLTFPMVLTQDPATGRRNLGIYRMHVYDGQTTGMHWQIQKGGRFHYRSAEEGRRRLPVVVALGGDPALMLAAAVPLPENLDEVAFAGLLRRRPYPLVPGKTVGLGVPANAEFVLEGYVEPDERAIEGPFGDHYGYYSQPALFPVFHLTKMTHRRRPVYPATVVGRPPQEDAYIGNAVQEMMVPLLRLIHPEVSGLWTYYEAGFHALAVAAVRVRYRKEAIRTALGLMGTGQLGLCKCMILVDAEVDPHNLEAVLQAVSRHFDPRRDFVLIPGAPIDTLDFASFRMHLGSRMIIDATAPVDEDIVAEGESAASGVPRDPEGGCPSVWRELGVLQHRQIGRALLVATVAGPGRAAAEGMAQASLPAGVRMVAVVSPDIDLGDTMSVLWGIFTRFDPARDVIFERAELQGCCPVYGGTLAIDATYKAGYPPPLEMPEEVRDRVSRRWGEYFVKKS